MMDKSRVGVARAMCRHSVQRPEASDWSCCGSLCRRQRWQSNPIWCLLQRLLEESSGKALG